MIRAARLLPLALCLISIPARLAAQAADTPPADKRPAARAAPDTGKYAVLTRNDYLYMAGFVAATVGVSQLDVRVAQKLQVGCTATAICVVNRTAQAFNLVGVPGAFVVSGGMYAIGRIARVPGLADAGLHTTEAVILAEAMTYLTKWSFGRERPYSAGTDDSDDFKFFRGLKGERYSSFPSGHASGAFAAASAATAEIGSRWPRAVVFVAPVFYGAAGMVAWARLQSNKHWLSDVFMGAGMGTLLGIKVVRYNHKHQGSKVDRFFLAGAFPAVTPTLGERAGVILSWSLRPTFLTRIP